MFLEHVPNFFGKQNCDRNGRGGRGNFNSNGRGFTLVGRYNGNHNPQCNFNILKWSTNNTT